MAALALGLRCYAGIDLVVGDLPRVVDVTPGPPPPSWDRKVMREELADLILRARLRACRRGDAWRGGASFGRESWVQWWSRIRRSGLLSLLSNES
jgi:predicted ATP-grasp superfamily ATP-dependent carboligase